MPDEQESEEQFEHRENTGSINRRRFVRLLSAAGVAATSTGIAGAEFTGSVAAAEGTLPNDMTVKQASIELAEHPTKPLAAFATTFLHDGYQLYLIRGENPAERPAVKAKQITNAQAGVHGLSWNSSSHRNILKYSMDGATYKQAVGETSVGKQVKTSDSPAPVTESPLGTTPSSSPEGTVSVMDANTKRVSYCVQPPGFSQYCANARGPETGRLKCASQPGGHTPELEHYQFEIVRGGEPHSGASFYYGQQVNDTCTWVGEENYSEWCWSYCKGDGIPGVSALTGAIETAINKAASSAGIVIPGIVVTALAYAIATGLIVVPPTGIPG